jgi:hypothetical protein
MSGVATTASKSIQPPWILSTISSPPTTSAPGLLASRCFSPASDYEHTLGLAETVRQHHGAAHHLVGVLRIDPEPNATSTVSSNFVNLSFLDERHGFFQRVAGTGPRPAGLPPGTSCPDAGAHRFTY